MSACQFCRRKCPIPRAPWAWADTGASFEPVCKESEACASYHGPKFSGPGCGTDKSSCSTGTFPCQCSGWGVGDLFRLEIVDTIKIPADLPAGDWVLGWRWDWYAKLSSVCDSICRVIHFASDEIDTPMCPCTAARRARRVTSLSSPDVLHIPFDSSSDISVMFLPLRGFLAYSLGELC